MEIVHSKATEPPSSKSQQGREDRERQAQEGECLPSPIPHLPEREADENMQAIQQGHNDIAKIYAQNAIRKQNERLNLLRLGSRIDAVASRVQTAVTIRQVTGSMMNVVKGMDQAMKAMDLEKVCPPPLFTALYRQDCFGADRRCRSQQ
jgi:hypothetical protein